MTKNKKWIFGIHIQGNVDWIGKWQTKTGSNFYVDK